MFSNEMRKIVLGSATSLVAAAVLLAGPVLAQAEEERGSRRGPPPEAFTACSGIASGDPCSFEAPHGSVAGSCREVREGEGLTCVPADHGERGERGGERR